MVLKMDHLYVQTSTAVVAAAIAVAVVNHAVNLTAMEFGSLYKTCLKHLNLFIPGTPIIPCPRY